VFSFLGKVFGAAHSPPRRGGVSAKSKTMDPFRFVADGAVSSARLRRPPELTTNYGFALSRSRFAPSSARRGIFGCGFAALSLFVANSLGSQIILMAVRSF